MEGLIVCSAVKTQPNEKLHIFCGSKEGTTVICPIARLLTCLYKILRIANSSFCYVLTIGQTEGL